MAPPSLERARSDGVTEQQAQLNMSKLLNDYYISNGEEALPLSPRYATETPAAKRVRLLEEAEAAKAAKEADKMVQNEKRTRSSKKTGPVQQTPSPKKRRISPLSKNTPESAKPQDSVASSDTPSPDEKPSVRRSPRNKTPGKRSLDTDGDGEVDQTIMKKARAAVTAPVTEQAAEFAAPPDAEEPTIQATPKRRRSSSDEQGASPKKQKTEPTTPRVTRGRADVKTPTKNNTNEATPVTRSDKWSDSSAPLSSLPADSSEESNENDSTSDEIKGAIGGIWHGKSLPLSRSTHRSPTAAVGTPTGWGYSAEAPADALLATPWPCAKPNCNSGQTYYEREGSKGYGRKVISNFFGRNKRQTNAVDNDVWHTFCRKDYQRGKYKADAGSVRDRCEYNLTNIEAQLVRLRLWRPEAAFTVKLTIGAEKRLSGFHKAMHHSGQTRAQVAATMRKVPKLNKKNLPIPLTLDDAFPMDLMDDFERTFTGRLQSYDALDQIMVWIRARVITGVIESMPPMEFLINTPTEGETVNDPTTNYARWLAHEDDADDHEPTKNEETDDAGDQDYTGDDGGENGDADASGDSSNNGNSDEADAGSEPNLNYGGASPGTQSNSESNQGGSGNHNADSSLSDTDSDATISVTAAQDSSDHESHHTSIDKAAKSLTPVNDAENKAALREWLSGSEIVLLGDGSVNAFATFMKAAERQADREGWAS